MFASASGERVSTTPPLPHSPFHHTHPFTQTHPTLQKEHEHGTGYPGRKVVTSYTPTPWDRLTDRRLLKHYLLLRFGNYQEGNIMFMITYLTWSVSLDSHFPCSKATAGSRVRSLIHRAELPLLSSLMVSCVLSVWSKNTYIWIFVTP